MKKQIINLAVAVAFAIASALSLKAMDLPVKTVNGTKCYYYSVKAGETLYSVSKKLGLSRDQIIESNPAAANGLSYKMELYFPVVDYSDNVGYKKHTVKRGETLFGISHKYGVPVRSIVSANPQAKEGVNVGMVLNIPDDAFAATNIPDQFSAAPDAPAPDIAADYGKTYESPVEEPYVEEPITYVVSLDDIDDEKDESALPEDPDEIQGNVIGAFHPEKRKQRPTPLTGEIDDEHENILNPPHVKTGIAKPDEFSTEEEDNSNAGDQFAGASVENSEPQSIVVMLPFMLTDEKPDKNAQKFTDFYRGLLIAADSLNRTGATQVKIIAFDTRNDLSRVKSLLTRQDVKESSVIIAPDDEAQLAAIADMAKEEAVYVFNILQAKDSTQYTNPYVIQANIGSQRMYAKAVDTMLNDFAGYTPVILRNSSSKPTKEPLVDIIKARYQAEKYMKPIEVEYDGTLSSASLSFADDGGKYIFVPASGNVNDFNKISGAIKTLRESAAIPDDIVLFGHPEWIAYRSDARELLHQLNAVAFSRFFYNPSNARSEQFIHRYARQYGALPNDVLPNHSQLGFDTGMYLINALRRNNGYFDNYFMNKESNYDGLQSSFRFMEPTDRKEIEGYENDALMIVRFTSDSPNCQVTVK